MLIITTKKHFLNTQKHKQKYGVKSKNLIRWEIEVTTENNKNKLEIEVPLVVVLILKNIIIIKANRRGEQKNFEKDETEKNNKIKWAQLFRWRKIYLN